MVPDLDLDAGGDDPQGAAQARRRIDTRARTSCGRSSLAAPAAARWSSDSPMVPAPRRGTAATVARAHVGPLAEGAEGERAPRCADESDHRAPARTAPPSRPSLAAAQMGDGAGRRGGRRGAWGSACSGGPGDPLSWLSQLVPSGEASSSRDAPGRGRRCLDHRRAARIEPGYELKRYRLGLVIGRADAGSRETLDQVSSLGVALRGMRNQKVALTELAVGADGAAVELDELLADEEAEAEARGLLLAAGGAEEAIEDAGEALLGDADALVLDADADERVARPRRGSRCASAAPSTWRRWSRGW